MDTEWGGLTKFYIWFQLHFEHLLPIDWIWSSEQAEIDKSRKNCVENIKYILSKCLYNFWQINSLFRTSVLYRLVAYGSGLG